MIVTIVKKYREFEKVSGQRKEKSLIRRQKMLKYRELVKSNLIFCRFLIENETKCVHPIFALATTFSEYASIYLLTRPHSTST